MQFNISYYKNKNAVILFLLLINIPGLFGQFDKLINYDVKDGVSSSDMYYIMQDSKGYIWSCGDMGISKFNGYEFKNFSKEDGLSDNTVFFMYEDAKERLWFSTQSGKLSFYKNNKINVLDCNDTLAKIIKDVFITSIYVDPGDTLWIGTAKTLLIKKNILLKIKPGWKVSDVKEIEVPEGKYFISFENNKFIFGGSSPEKCTITKYTKSLKKIYTIDPGFDNKNKRYLRFYLTLLKDGSYLASFNKQLFKFTDQKIVLQKEEHANVIYSKQINDSSLIICTYDGVSVYHDKDLAIRTTIRQLSNKIVTGICNDNEDGLWFTTEGHGLYYIPHRNFAYYTAQNGIPESKISCMGLYDSKVLVGHLDGTASILYKDSVNTLCINPKTDFDQSGRLTSICNYKGNTFITSMKNSGCLKNNKFKLLGDNKPHGTKKFMKSNDGNILGLNWRGIAKYFTGRSYEAVNLVYLYQQIDAIFEDSNNLIWIGAADGIYTYDYKNLDTLSKKNQLFVLRASDISEAKDKSIWLATRGGGVIIKTKNKIIHLTEKNGLAGNMCRCLFMDSNYVWVGTNKGLSRISILQNNNYAIENFYARNGLLTNEVNSIIKYNNKLWLAHNNGVSVFDIANIRPNTYPPPVYIVQTLVNDHVPKDLMQLGYDKNYLTIKYIGLSYKDAGNIEYKYKVEGIDSNWINTHYTTVNYRTIPPGSYRFVVYAKNNDGYWSSVPATFTFKILPPWWKTWLFIISVIIFIILFISIAFKYRLSIIKKREQLKMLQQTELSNAELKALRSQMNPHFVFNAINSVQYFITNNDPLSSQKYLSKFARLIRYVVDNSKPSAILLSKELDALNLYLDLESLRFENKFEFSIHVDDNIDPENIQIPSMLIQPYVENAIWHGLMHKKNNGKVKIEISMRSNILFCVIEDNGIGRKRSREIAGEKNNAPHKSIGMSLTQERLRIINQQNNSNLTVTIIDLKSEDGIGAGTRVELNLPFD